MSTSDPFFNMHTGSSLRPTDDLISLKQHLPGGQFRYIDIVTEQAHQEAIKRWPLMEELHQNETHANRRASSSSLDMEQD